MMNEILECFNKPKKTWITSDITFTARNLVITSMFLTQVAFTAVSEKFTNKIKKVKVIRGGRLIYQGDGINVNCIDNADLNNLGITVVSFSGGFPLEEGDVVECYGETEEHNIEYNKRVFDYQIETDTGESVGSTFKTYEDAEATLHNLLDDKSYLEELCPDTDISTIKYLTINVMES